MSRAIFVQDIPAGITSIDEIDDAWRPAALAVTVVDVRNAILAVEPGAGFDDSGWGRVETDSGLNVEVDLGNDDPLMSFAVHIRGDQGAGERFVATVLGRLGLKAFDPESDSGLFCAHA